MAKDAVRMAAKIWPGLKKKSCSEAWGSSIEHHLGVADVSGRWATTSLLWSVPNNFAPFAIMIVGIVIAMSLDDL